MNLTDKKCIPCEDGSVAPMTIDAARSMMEHVPLWKLDESVMHIDRTWIFADFVVAMKFVSAVAVVVEVEGHHPDIHIAYNHVRLELWTHAIKGLSENDFIVAAKIDQIVI